jgi:hypothetical protein
MSGISAVSAAPGRGSNLSNAPQGLAGARQPYGRVAPRVGLSRPVTSQRRERGFYQSAWTSGPFCRVVRSCASLNVRMLVPDELDGRCTDHEPV